MTVQDMAADGVLVLIFLVICALANCEAKAEKCVMSCYRDPPVCIYENRDAGPGCTLCRDVEDAGSSCEPWVKEIP